MKQPLKKYILSFLIIATFSMLPSFGDSAADSADPRVTDTQDIIYQSPLNDFTDSLTNEDYYDERYFDDRSQKEVDPYKMPVFKQMRIKLTNKYRQITSDDKPKSQTTFVSRLKIRDKKTAQNASPDDIEKGITDTSSQSDLWNTIDNTANIETSDSVLLDGGVQEEEVEKQLLLDASRINFDDESGDMVATGRPILFLPPQNTKIIADKMMYNDDGNILKAIGNVIVIKDGKPIHSDYLEIDMNEELLTSNNIFTEFPKMNFKAESGQQRDGLVVLNNGSMYSDNSYIYKLTSRTVGATMNEMILDKDSENLFFGDPTNNKLNIKMSYLEVAADKNHDTIKAKDIKFMHNDKVFFKWPSITLYTDKEHSYFEGNYPEFGSRRKMGAFIGPGFAFKGPFGSVMKVIPLFNYRSGIGFGGMLKYVNAYNRTELGYGSANDIFFLRGKQTLDDNLNLQYAYNSYTNEWFLGGMMPKYIAELAYDRSYPHKDFLAKNMDMTFRQRATFGFMKDDDKSYNGEKFNDATNMSTTRTRYMAEVDQTFLKYKNKDLRAQFNAGVRLQGSAALYGNGDTQFVARVGPYIKTQFRNWVQDITYFQTGFDDQTPIPHFDAYRYGKSSLRITEALRITKYLTVGWYGYVNFSDDAPNGKTFQENAFLVSLGPDDLKIILGYDTIRDRVYFGFNVAFDPKGTTINYDKLVIKNPERLGKHPEDNEQKVAYSPAQPQKEEQKSLINFKKTDTSKPKVLEYAQVIELEDPDKERIN